MRSLWNMLVQEPELRATAYALVAVVFEVAVVTAPALAAGIASLWSPTVAVVVAGGLGVGSALAFTSTGPSRAWRGTPHDVGWLGPLGAPGMRTVFGALVAFGTAVGIVQVAVPAFADARGSAATGGVLLAALSAGSLAGGLIYGGRVWPGTLPDRLPVLLTGLGGALRVARAGGLLPDAGGAAGALRAAARAVDRGRLDAAGHGRPGGTVTEAFAAMVMGIVAGTAIGNALGGALVESASFEVAVLAAGGIAVAGAAFALARRRTLERPSVARRKLGRA